MTTLVNPRETVWKVVTYPYMKRNKYEVNNHGIIRDIESKEVIPTFFTNEWVSVKLEHVLRGNRGPYITVPIHLIVAYEFCETLLDKTDVDSYGVNHIDLDHTNYKAYNLEYVPFPIKILHDENVLHACILKELETSISKIEKITGESKKFLTKLFYDEGKRRSITKFFELKNGSMKSQFVFNAKEMAIIKHLILLGYKHEDICRIFDEKYTFRAFRQIEELNLDVIEEVRDGILPQDLNFEDAKWKDAIEHNDIIRNAVENYIETHKSDN